jgi:hypothetical protein
MEKNNLDNLFQDKFKDFSETPDERVWEKIEASLDKKKKKRIVPLWWQLGGAAAALALLMYLINPFSKEEETTLPTVVDTEEQAPVDLQKNTEENSPDSKVFKESQENQVVGTSKTDTSSEGSSDAEQELSGTNKTQKKGAIGEKQNLVTQHEALADRTKNQKSDNTSFIASKNNPNMIQDKKKVVIVENTEEVRDQKDEENILDPNKTIETESKVAATENKTKDDNTISIFDAIDEQKELEKEAVAEQSDKRWAMGPSVAPVFFGSVGEGSPIHSNFASNTKSGNLNLSYGLTVTYNVSKKLSIRSGVHRVDYGYDTNDVVFTSSLTTSTNQLIDNISYAQTSRNLVVESKNNSSSVATFNDNSNFGGQAQPFEGRMVQQLGYVEVPMELNYALLNKKFGINLIGGVSSLFLVDNAVSLQSDQLITEMGEANNANDVNFSTNIGIGFNYEISQKLQLNVEPIFKYQLNTFSETAGNFRPYAVGVYSGLNFRF